MTLQSTAPIESMTMPVMARSAREIARLAVDGNIDLNPPYQRGSVWTTEQQIALVRSWLAGVPVPAVAINDRFGASRSAGSEHVGPEYAVIDGKQRIETAVAWFFGELTVPASWFKSEDVLETVATDDGPYVAYKGLSTPAKTDMAFNSKLPLIETRLQTIEEEAAIYVLLERSGSPQTEADVARAQRVAEGA